MEERITITFTEPFIQEYNRLKVRVNGRPRKNKDGNYIVPIRLINPIEVYRGSK